MKRILMIFSAVLLAACEQKRDGQYEVTISETRELTSLDVPHKLDASAMARFSSAVDSSFESSPPQDWVQIPVKFLGSSQLEDERYQVAGATVTVSKVGGSENDNINRWAGQFSQEAMSLEQISKLPEITLAGAKGRFVELEGTFAGMPARGIPAQENQAMLGMIATVRPGLLVVVKMTGPADIVASQKESFTKFCADLKFKPEAEPKPETEEPKG